MVKMLLDGVPIVFPSLLTIKSKASFVLSETSSLIPEKPNKLVPNLTHLLGKLFIPSDVNEKVAVLFGDGASAFYLEATDKEEGLLAEELGCYGDVRDILTVHGWGMKYANQGIPMGQSKWQFEGQKIFKKAVDGMVSASEKVLEKCGLTESDMDLVIPHQANLRIINAVAKKLGVPRDKVFVNVHRYGNMSAATAPIALVEAVEEGRISPHAKILVPAFGGGLTWCAHVIQWGERVDPLGESDVKLPPCDKTGLELVEEIRAKKELSGGRSPTF